MPYSVKRKWAITVQTDEKNYEVKHQGTQCNQIPGSYNRASTSTYTAEKNFTYDDLLLHYLCNTKHTLQWLKDENLIATSRICPICGMEMIWTKTGDRSDGYKWECRKQKIKDKKRHKSEFSIRQNSWFEKSKMTIPEIIKVTYWWSADLTQKEICRQLKLGTSTVVDWCNFSERYAR